MKITESMKKQLIKKLEEERDNLPDVNFFGDKNDKSDYNEAIDLLMHRKKNDYLQSVVYHGEGLVCEVASALYYDDLTLFSDYGIEEE